MDKKAISNDSWLYLYEFLKNEFIFRDLWKARECTLNMYLAANHTKQHTGQRRTGSYTEQEIKWAKLQFCTNQIAFY